MLHQGFRWDMLSLMAGMWLRMDRRGCGKAVGQSGKVKEDS